MFKTNNEIKKSYHRHAAVSACCCQCIVLEATLGNACSAAGKTLINKPTAHYIAIGCKLVDQLLSAQENAACINDAVTATVRATLNHRSSSICRQEQRDGGGEKIHTSARPNLK